MCSLEQMELFSPTDGCPSAVDLKLGVNASGVRPQGAQGHHELVGNVRAAQVGPEQPKHVTLTIAQRLAQSLFDGCPALSRAEGGQEVTDVARSNPAFRGRFQQDRHG